MEEALVPEPLPVETSLRKSPIHIRLMRGTNLVAVSLRCGGDYSTAAWTRLATPMRTLFFKKIFTLCFFFGGVGGGGSSALIESSYIL